MSTAWKRLEEIIHIAEADGCEVGVTVLFADNKSYRHNDNRIFLAASTIKLAIMVSIFQRIDCGNLSLDDSIVLEASHKVPGAGIVQGLHDGITLTISDLLYLMISISDNPSTNLLIDHVGLEGVNQTLQGLGLVQSKLIRKMEGRAAQGIENENLATPMEFALLLKQIFSHTAASPKSCQHMLWLLSQQQNNRRIGRYVPNREGVHWGSKTGTSTRLVNDVGFIQSDDGLIIVSVFTAGFPENSIGEQLVADISRAAMEATGVVKALRPNKQAS